MSDGAPIPHFRPFNAERLGLAVDALTRGALVVDGVVERSIAIEQGAHQAAFLPIGVLDAAFAFEEWGVFAGLARAGGKEQGAAKALGEEAVGVPELVGGMHAQARRATWRAIGIQRHLLVTMGVEGNGANALSMGHRLIDVPEIKGGIGCDMERELVQGQHAA